MAPRRQLLLLLSAIALLMVPLVVAPRLAQAEPGDYTIDTLSDLSFDPATAAGTYCKISVANDCSLRRAIGEANRDGIASDISLQPGLEGVINIDAGLGGLVISAGDLTLDARPVAPDTGIKLRLHGGSATFPGLRITSSNVQIFGLSITGFSAELVELGAGIHFDGPGATGNTVSGSYLGVLPDGTVNASSGNRFGVLITGGASGNTVTGSLIGGNRIVGVRIDNSDNNTIVSSSIGIGPGGTDIGNEEAGVLILSSGGGTSNGNIIGGSTQGLANTISGNGPPGQIFRAGIILSGGGTSGNFIRANRIGLNVPGQTPVANSGDGIRIEAGANNNTIGGVTAPLIISGNSGYGIRITGSGTFSNTVSTQVFVGPTALLDGAAGNSRGGIAVDQGATATSINGSTIAGNAGGPGVLVTGASVAGTVVSNSSIGRFTNSGGALQTLPNQVGVQIENAGSTSVLSSTISSNAGPGILVRATGPVTVTANSLAENSEAGVLLENTSNVVVFTNTITGHLQPGLLLRGALGSSVLSNTLTANAGGILLESSAVSPTRVSALTGNIVSGNDLFGVRLSDALTTTMVRNYIGLGLSLAGSLPNEGNGLELLGARNTAATDTYVAGNLGAGIVVSGTGTLTTTLNNTVAGLAFGTVGFTESAPNGGPAVYVTGGARNTVLRSGTLGGAAADGSGDPGVLIEGTGGVTVSLLRIGWVPESDSPGATALERPFGVGISVTGTLSDVQILSNTLRFNRGAAVAVSGNAQRVRMLGNGLSRNGDAISLVGTTRLDPPRDVDPGSRTNPNHDIDPPPVDVTSFSDPLRLRVGDQGVIDGYVITSTNLLESGLSPVSACISCTIQVFRPGPGEAGATPGQGYTVVNTVPLDGGFQDSAASFQVAPNGRFTRQLVGGVGAPGSQLLLVATDGFGNSSEYAVFPVSTGFQLASQTPNQQAIPGQTVTYTLRLSNTGTLDVTGLSLRTSGTLRGWRVSTDPVTNTIFTAASPLEAGTSRLLTVTLTLPRGPNPNVNAGVTDVTTVTVVKANSTLSQSVRLETTVLPSPVLVVTPTTSLGSARPNETVPHTHVIRNDGNVTVTLGLESSTVDPVGTTGTWVTALSTDSLTLGPGEESRVRVDVTVPNGAQVEDTPGNPVQAVTYVTATVPVSPTGGFGPVSVSFTDTTRVNLNPDAVLFNTDQEEPGAAGQTVVFPHAVENKSNAPTRFCFVWSTNLGSTVSFVSRTDGFAIDANGCFSLDTTTSIPDRRFQRAEFDALVLVNRRLLPGDREVVNISLRNETTGELIGSARVVDRVNVLLGQRLPRLWMPLVRR